MKKGTRLAWAPFFVVAQLVSKLRLNRIRQVGACAARSSKSAQDIKFIAYVLNGRVVGICGNQLIEPQVGLRQLSLGADGRNSDGMEG
jgi:hypothetical protein